MDKQGRRDNAGLTLLELTIAVAIFVIILGTAAQALISFHFAQDMQQQRGAAAHNMRSVLSSMRNARDANPDSFPEAITTQWPDGVTLANEGTELGEAIMVAYTDATANPLEVTITSSWSDMRGRAMSLSLSTVLTNR